VLFIYVYLFIYLFYLKFIHDLFNGASSSSEFTSSIESLIIEELMTRENKCERMQCCPNLRYHYGVQFDWLRKMMKNHCKLTDLR